MIIRFLFLLFLVLPVYLDAQTFSCRHYSLEEGLPSSQVYDALQDDQGFMWFGTDRGVVRFDGYEFEIFTTDDGLLDNVVFHLYKDHLGRIWFASFSGQLCYYHEGEIKPYAYNHIISEELGRALFMGFIVDANEGVHLSVWMSAYVHIDHAGNLTHFRGKNHEYEIQELGDEFILYRVNKKQTGFAEGDYIDLLYTDNDGRITTYKSPFKREEHQNGLMKGPLCLNDAIYFSVENKLFELNNEKIRCVYTDENQINALFISEDDIWLGTHNSGFVILDLDTENKGVTRHLDGRTICSFFEDNEGAVWITTLNNGIYYLSNQKHYSLTENSGLPVRDVFSMASSGNELLMSDSKGELFWLNLLNDSVKRATEWTAKVSRPSEIEYLESFNSFFLRSNYQFVQIRQGKQAVSYDKRGYFVGKADSIFYMNYTPGAEADVVNGIHFIPLVLGEKAKSLGARNIHLAGGHTYISGLGGIQEIRTKPNREIDSIYNLSNKHPLFATRVVQMAAYEGYDFIAATRGEGIIFVKNGVPHALKKKDGLISNQITCVFIDSAQTIWAGSSDGISVIDKKRGIVNLRKEDGLISNEITSIWANESKAYIGTKRGLTILDRDQIFKKNNDIPVVFKSIRLENKEIIIRDENKIEIGYSEPFLAIEFIGISYKSNGRVNYKYRLNEDEGWQYTTINKLLLSNLESGDYRLEVYASRKDGQWSEEPAILEINVSFPVWKTIWFKSIIFLIFCLFLVLIYKLVVNQIKRREKIERQIQNLRFEALSAQMNPHFMFNSLNSIQNFIIKNERKASVQYLSKFAKLMRKTLDHSQQKNITLNSELEALYLYLDLEILRFGNSINYEVTIDPEIQKEKNILPALLIQPIVENAILHGLRPKVGPGLIRLKFSKTKNHLVIQVEDDGVGREMIESNKLEHHSKGSALTEGRIALFAASFDASYEYAIVDLKEDGEAAGTQVNIKIPYILQNEFNSN